MRVEFINQQDGWAFDGGLQRLQDRAADEGAASGEDVLARASARSSAPSASASADLDHLRLVIPLIDRGAGVEAFVALEPDQAAAERIGEHLGDLGLADACLTLEKERAAHLER